MMRHLKKMSLPAQAPGAPRRSIAFAMCAFALIAPACSGTIEGAPGMGGNTGTGTTGGNVGQGGNVGPGAGGSSAGGPSTTTGGNGPSTTGGTAGAAGNGSGGKADTSPCVPGTDARLLPASQRVVRLTARQYVNSARSVINAAAAEKLAANVSSLADRLVPSVRKFPPLAGEDPNIIGTEFTNLDLAAQEAGKYVRENFSAATMCMGTATDACATAWLKASAARAYRRPLTSAEDTRLTALYNRLKSQDVNGYRVTNSVEVATGYAVNALLMTPQFLWRSEMGGTQMSTSPAGVYLTDQELASNLSYFLTDQPPDTQLVMASTANDGSLRTNLRSHVDRMLQQQVTKDWLTNVIETNYGLNQLPTVPIDEGIFPIYNTTLMTAMLDEANLFLKNILFNGNLTDMFLSRTSFLNPLLANEIYKVPVPAGATPTNYAQTTLPSDQRAGILTNSAFITARARSNGIGLVVSRGRMVSAAILCMPQEPPGDDIAAAVTAAKGSIATTTAQAQVKSRDNGLCGECHKHIDPYGLVLEYYDNLGRYRTMDHLGPVDGTTKLPDVIGGGTVTNAVQLAEKMAASPSFTQCMATTVLQYALVDFDAHVEMPAEGKAAGCASLDLVSKYNSANGKTFGDMVRATTATAAFAVRKKTQ